MTTPARTELRIDRLGHRGDGIGRAAGGGTVYVDRALPGEVVAGELTADASGEGSRRIPRPSIVTPSPHRIAAPCPHYRACGGCSVMHADDRFVADWKTGIVRTALEAQGVDAEVAGIATSPPESRRRAAFGARRTKSGPLVGFHGRMTDALTRVDRCRVVTPALRATIPSLEEITALVCSRSSRLRLTVTDTLAGVDIDMDLEMPPGGGFAAQASELARIAERAGLARITLRGETAVLRQPPEVAFDGVRVPLPAGAFLQATTQGEDALRAVVMQGADGADRALDLFAGCGTFALPLARGRSVHAVEGESSHVSALLDGWRRATGLRQVTAETRDLFRRPLLGDELARFDAVVIDPPRAGAEAQMRALAGSAVPVVVSLSCNPATFARDARILAAGGFRPGRIHVVDQFRWSSHVELAAVFRR